MLKIDHYLLVLVERLPPNDLVESPLLRKLVVALVVSSARDLHRVSSSSTAIATTDNDILETSNAETLILLSVSLER